MQKRWLILAGAVTFLLLLASCSTTTSTASPSGIKQATPTSISTATTGIRGVGNSSDTGNTIIDDHNISTMSFSTSGALNGSYVFKSSPTLSKLRHGHQEFTIDLIDKQQSIILAFYGYNGPGSYMLTNSVNGGDVRLENSQGVWDLALQPQSSCSLTINSETPTQDPALHNMTGTFACSDLPTNSQVRAPIAIQHGQFNIFIIVES